MGEFRLDKRTLAQSRTIARGRRIRDVDRLVATYGGRVAGWAKRSSPPLRFGDHVVEYHWYEHAGIGRVEIKPKVLD